MDYQALYSTKSSHYYSGKRDDVLNYLPENLDLVLDVGCSSGEFGKLLKQKGLTVWGVEPDTASAEEAKSKLDRVFNDLFDDKLLQLFGDVKFDCIFFNDVLEHLVDPEAALALCKKILKPNGYVVSAIPNVLQYGNIVNILKTQDWQYTDQGILDKTHLRFYTKKSIVRLFQQCEYDLISIDGTYATCSKKFIFLNYLLFNKIESMKYTHFISVARKPD